MRSYLMLNDLPLIRLRGLRKLTAFFLNSFNISYPICLCPKAKLQFQDLYSSLSLSSLNPTLAFILTGQHLHLDHPTIQVTFDLFDVQVGSTEERLLGQSPPFTLTCTICHYVSSCSALFIPITILRRVLTHPLPL